MLSTHIMFITLVISVIVTNVYSEKISPVVQIIPRSDKQLHFLYNLNNELDGAIFWKDPTDVNKTVDLMVPGEQFKNFESLMRENKLAYTIEIPNVQELLNNASVPIKRTRNKNRQFGFGNFGWTQFHTLDEIYSWLDSLTRNYPNNVRIIEAGKSYEGRPIKGVHLRFSQNRPGVFIEAGIHAREWLSHTTATYLINELLTSSNSEIQKLAQSFDWYIFPCVNPDGYVYTHIDPRDAQYRLWRKNRSPNAAIQCSMQNVCQKRICYGADLNRNWNTHWGGAGSGRDACGEVFSGNEPFSEIETKSLAQFISSLNGKLFAYISFHTFIEKLMFPYGHTSEHLDNYNEQYTVGMEAANALSKRYGTQYKVGNIAEILGAPASGGSVDWVKTNLRIPFVYCYELRGHTSSGQRYAFTPPPSEIIPNGQEVMDSLVALFRAATQYYPQSNGNQL